MHASELYAIWHRFSECRSEIVIVGSIVLLDCIFPDKTIAIEGCGIVSPMPTPAEVAFEVAQYFAISAPDPCVAVAVCDWVRSRLPELCIGASQTSQASVFLQFFAERLIDVPLLDSCASDQDQQVTAFCLYVLCTLLAYNELDTIYRIGCRVPSEAAQSDIVTVEFINNQMFDRFGIPSESCDYRAFVERAIQIGFLRTDTRNR